MQISDQGLDLLTQREGKRNAAYLDSKGIVTIGVGHVSPDVKLGDVWTDEQVETALRKDLAWVEAAINRGVKNTIMQYEFDALASFTFNVGQGAFASSTLLRLLNAGEPVDTVAAQFDRWHIPPEIASRRNGEREQFRGTQFVARIEGESNGWAIVYLKEQALFAKTRQTGRH